MTFGRYVLTADVTVAAGTASFPAAGPSTTATGTTSAAPAGGTSIGTGVAITAGTWLLSWTVQLATAAAAGDANNFVLTNSTTTLATSVNTGTVASFPQTAVTYYTGASVTILPKVGSGAGTTGSVYKASVTVTPLMSGDSRGVVAWTGAGSPAQWATGFSVLFRQGTPLWLDTGGALYAALGSGNLRAWTDGTDNVGHGHWGAISN